MKKIGMFLSVVVVCCYASPHKTTRLTDNMSISSTRFPQWMVKVDGGTFMMGDNGATEYEKPVHSVALADFYISKYEVTHGLWKKVMGKNPSGDVGRNKPVESITWYDAIHFCNALNRYMGLSECYVFDGDSVFLKDNVKDGFRLPTEEEWEYAARGGRYSHGYKYAGGNHLQLVAWTDTKNVNGIHHVGTKTPNELGAYDMTGNVAEFCWDDAHLYNMVGNDVFKVFSKIIRGGGYTTLEGLSALPVTSRSWVSPNSCSMDVGVRLVFVGDTNKINTIHEPIPTDKEAVAENVDTVNKMMVTKGNFPNWMVKVDSGRYTLGAKDHDAYAEEKPKHTVNLPSFFVSKYEVTQGLWTQIMGHPSHFRGSNFPIDSVSFYDCVRFCNALSEYCGCTPCYRLTKHRVMLLNKGKGGFRLPTEDEWECAARGGQKSRGYHFAGSNNMRKVAWCIDNSGGSTHHVGMKQPNELGLYDMSGNVWERCWDADNDNASMRGSSVKCLLFDFNVEYSDGCLNDDQCTALGLRIVFEP